MQLGIWITGDRLAGHEHVSDSCLTDWVYPSVHSSTTGSAGTLLPPSLPSALGLCKCQLHLCPSHSTLSLTMTPGQLSLFSYGGCDLVQSHSPVKALGGHFSGISFVLVFLFLGFREGFFLVFSCLSLVKSFLMLPLRLVA